MKVKIITLGCKVNQYESEVMLQALLDGGFQKAEKGQPADVVVLNSCTVTAQSNQKARQTLRRAKRENPDAVAVLTGCMPQAFPEEAEAFVEADIVLGTVNRAALLPHILTYLSSKQRIVDVTAHSQSEPFEKMQIRTFQERTRAFLKIEDGCNRFCSYCIIPFARGRVRSKPLADIEEEVKALAGNGYKEIVLTGINLPAYGQDLGLHLCDAVETTCAVSGIERVRLGSLEPEQLTPPVIDRLAKEKKLCPQFHLSLQSGCDETLKRMNRHYTTADYRKITRDLRAAFSNAAITTDLMVGFPGETQEEFDASLKFMQEIAFSKVHVFAYSRRPGTRAYDAPGQCTQKVKEQRSHQMIAAASALQRTFFDSQQGLVEKVLFEREVRKNVYEGYTRNYTPVLASSPVSLCGEILPVKIESAGETHCFCKVCENS